jgi:hypothetical protein
LNYSCGFLAATALLLCSSYSRGDGFSGSGHKSNAPANPDVSGDNYVVDDGSAEDDIGITGSAASFDFIWLNSFARQNGAEVINQISVAYGSPADPRFYNGLPVKVLLYGDANGGSPTDATLLYSLNATIANSNTNTFQHYAIPNVTVPGTFLVGVVAKNMATNNAYLAGIDYTAPTFSNVSYGGYTLVGNTLNETNLGSVPNFGAMESFGLAGNWLVRANGVSVPEPASLAVPAAAAVLMSEWRRQRPATARR